MKISNNPPERANTPAELEEMVYHIEGVTNVRIIENFTADSAMIVVCIRLNFWRSLRCILSSSYRVKSRINYLTYIAARIPMGVRLQVLLEL